MSVAYGVTILKVADFLGDSETIEEVSQRLAQQLMGDVEHHEDATLPETFQWKFHESSTCRPCREGSGSSEEGRAPHALGVLLELPKHLAGLVIQHSTTTPTASLLLLLPRELHGVALLSRATEAQSALDVGTIHDHLTMYALQSALAGTPEVTNLGLRVTLPTLLLHLPSLPQLRRLDLSQAHRSGRETAALAACLAGMPHLEGLDLKDTNLTAKAMKALMRGLAPLTNLNTLDLSVNDISSEGAITLAPTLATLSLLRHLDLSAADIGARGAVALAPALVSLTHLQVFNISSNTIMTRGSIALIPRLRSLPSLRHLDLGHNKLSHGGAAALAATLSALSSLTALHLRSNWLLGRGAASLATLPYLSALQVLDLEACFIYSVGARVLAPVLGSVSTLQRLNLRFNLLEDEGAAQLLAPLAALSALTSVDLSCNDITEERARLLAASLILPSALQCDTFVAAAEQAMERSRAASDRPQRRCKGTATVTQCPII